MVRSSSFPEEEAIIDGKLQQSDEIKTGKIVSLYTKFSQGASLRVTLATQNNVALAARKLTLVG